VRSSTGTMPTDKKFTGQRLDQTGLYYYNARYYDATIGRFISADTIVPDVFNPQTLNRYSYCLNNPLKYVDPSGHEVDINGYNVAYIYADMMAFLATGQMLSQGTMNAMSSPIFTAYDALRSIDPCLLNALEKSNIQFNIIYHDMGTLTWNGHGYSPIGARVLSDHTIELNSSPSYDQSQNALITRLAHESVHAFGQTLDPGNVLFDSSQFEEAVAYRYQYMISRNLGIDPGDCQRFYDATSLDQSTLNSLFAGSIYESCPSFPNGSGQTSLTADESIYMTELSKHVNEWRKEALSFY
jgi:RHS repeat-associated protein